MNFFCLEPTILRRYSAMKRCYGKINPLDWICKCRKNFQSGQNLGNIQNCPSMPNKFLIIKESQIFHPNIKGKYKPRKWFYICSVTLAKKDFDKDKQSIYYFTSVPRLFLCHASPLPSTTRQCAPPPSPSVLLITPLERWNFKSRVKVFDALKPFCSHVYLG